jgi:hypothetical protein
MNRDIAMDPYFHQDEDVAVIPDANRNPCFYRCAALRATGA